MIVYGHFEWSMRDAAANLAKHNITFKEAASVFADQAHVVTSDAPGGLRVVGLSSRNRQIVVEHQRGPRIRILSASLQRAEKAPSRSAAPPPLEAKVEAPPPAPVAPAVVAPPVVASPVVAPPKSERRPRSLPARRPEPEPVIEPAPKSGRVLRAVAAKSEPPPKAGKTSKSVAPPKSEPPPAEAAPKSARAPRMSWRAAAALARLSS
jgi:uncharacterized DUF497 family protein